MERMSGIKKDNMHYDVVIIGGGPGGTRAAKILGRAEKRVALISNELGGECLNYGCIPTKAYLWSAEVLEKVRGAESLGIMHGDISVNWGKMKERQKEVVLKLKRGLRATLEAVKVEIIEGMGSLKDAHTVAVGEKTFEADYIILATGSSALFPPGIEKSEKVLSNKEILDLPEIPKTLLIIGGGAIGVEFASLFSVLGSAVTIMEMADRILPQEDLEISHMLARIFARMGITIQTNVKAGPEIFSQFEKVLVAVGRKPAFSGLGLEQTGMQITNGQIATNETMQTNLSHIFAIGDLAGKALLAYTAEREADIAAASILGRPPQHLNYGAVVNTIFSIPEVASVGLTQSKAETSGTDFVLGKGLFSANAKAFIVGQRDGFAKIIAEKQTGKLLGVHMIGEKATELIAEASLAIATGLTLEQLNANLHSHPILGEVLKEACENCENAIYEREKK